MLNILLFGAGGGSCIGVVKSLRVSEESYNIIVTDTDRLSAGFYLADKSYVIPPASKKYKFIEKIRKIIQKEKINIILPTSGFYIEPLSFYKKKIGNLGVKVLINDYETVMICHDKLKLKNYLKSFYYI